MPPGFSFLDHVPADPEPTFGCRESAMLDGIGRKLVQDQAHRRDLRWPQRNRWSRLNGNGLGIRPVRLQRGLHRSASAMARPDIDSSCARTSASKRPRKASRYSSPDRFAASVWRASPPDKGKQVLHPMPEFSDQEILLLLLLAPLARRCGRIPTW
jgi:hypothetical protein